MLINDTLLMPRVRRVYVGSYHCFGLFFFPSTLLFLGSSMCAIEEVLPFVPPFSSRASKMEQLHDLRMLFHPERFCRDFQMCVAIWQALTCLVGVKSSN